MVESVAQSGSELGRLGISESGSILEAHPVVTRKTLLRPPARRPQSASPPGRLDNGRRGWRARIATGTGMRDLLQVFQRPIRWSTRVLIIWRIERPAALEFEDTQRAPL